MFIKGDFVKYKNKYYIIDGDNELDESDERFQYSLRSEDGQCQAEFARKYEILRVNIEETIQYLLSKVFYK